MFQRLDPQASPLWHARVCSGRTTTARGNRREWISACQLMTVGDHCAMQQKGLRTSRSDVIIERSRRLREEAKSHWEQRWKVVGVQRLISLQRIGRSLRWKCFETEVSSRRKCLLGRSVFGTLWENASSGLKDVCSVLMSDDSISWTVSTEHWETRGVWAWWFDSNSIPSLGCSVFFNNLLDAVSRRWCCCY